MISKNQATQTPPLISPHTSGHDHAFLQPPEALQNLLTADWKPSPGAVLGFAVPRSSGRRL